MVNPDGFWRTFDRYAFKRVNLVSLTVSAIALITVGLVGIFYTAHFYLFATMLIIGLSIAACMILGALAYAVRLRLNRR
jgi:cyanate permease